jgi:PAS domain S-box-containing protein
MTESRARKQQPLDQPEDNALWTELVESEARLRAMMQATGAAVVSTDDQLLVKEFNPAAERIFGRHSADVVGRRYSELFPAALRQKIDSDLSRVLGGKTIRLFENVIMDPAGHTTVVLWDIRRFLSADGRTLGVVAVGHDITARQHSEPL